MAKPNYIEDEKYLRPSIEYKQIANDHNLAKEFIQVLSENLDTTYLIDSSNGAKWTGRDIIEGASRVAVTLKRDLKMENKQNILISSDHSGRDVIFAIGVVLAGCAFIANDPEDGIEEIYTVCDIVGVNAIAISSRYHQLALGLRKKSHQLARCPIIWIDDQSLPTNNGDQDIDLNNNNNSNGQMDIYKIMQIQEDRIILLDDILMNDAQADIDFVKDIANNHIKPDDPTHYVLTSGSTGFPKVVECTHRMDVESVQSVYLASLPDEHDADSLRTFSGLSSNCILAGDLPLDHGAAMTILLPMFKLKSKIVIITPYDIEKFWKAVHDYKITNACTGTSFVYRLLMYLKEFTDKSSFKYDISSLQSILAIGSKLEYYDLVEEITKRHPNLKISQRYGCSEIGYITGGKYEKCLGYIDSVGLLMPGLIGKVVDTHDDSRILGPNQKGELRVWARSKFKRYLCRNGIDPKEAYDNCHDSENFYRTGDVVHYDDSGRIYIHGRLKETLVLGQDWKIMPAELEAIVNEHPLVEQSIIIGLPDPDNPTLHAPKAYIKLISKFSTKYQSLIELGDKQLLNKFQEGDLEFIAKDIYFFSANRTSKVKHLKGGVKIIDEFPRNGRLQKVDRKALKEIN